MQLLFLGEFLSSVFMGIIMTLDTFIYSLVNSSYRIFMAIASARLLSSDVYYEIANKIYIVVGVLMLFVLSYSILKAIVNPDELSKENNGAGIVKRIAIAVIGLAITPVLFNVLYQAQGLFLEQDVLGKIFFRIDNTENVSISGAVNASGNPDEQIKTIGGAVAATSIWQAFFHPAEGINAADIKADPSDYYAQAAGTAAVCGLGIAIGVIGVVAGVFTFGVGSALAAGAAVGLCAMSIQGDIEAGNELTAKYNGEEISLEEAYAIVAAGGKFDIFLIFMDNYLEDGEIEYFWGISTICGAFALYAFVSFSIDMGVRAAKLAYFQIIAPVPLVMQVLPKFKETLGKYISQVVSTFVEVFIRISIVYIVTFVVCHLTDLFSSFGTLWGSTSLNTPEKLIALALLIIGLILFAKSAPEIITSSLNLPKGNMSLGIGKKMRDAAEASKVYAAGAIAGAGATSAVRSWNKSKSKGLGKIGSALTGMGSGMARAAFNQFGPGPHRKEAKDWESMKNVASRAAMAVGDKKDKTNQLLDSYNAAHSDYETAKANYNAATNDADRAKFKAQMDEAYKRMMDSTLFADQLQSMGKSIRAWAVGTVDMSKEQAALKFAAALNKTKDTVREEAFKKDNPTKALKTRYDELMAKTVSEYRDGWDDESYNAELRRRMNDTSTREGAQYKVKQDEYDALYKAVAASRQALDQAKANGLPQADIDRLTRQLENDKASLSSKETELAAARKVISDGLDSVAKRSDSELSAARMQLEVDRKDAKDLMEAAADMYVAQQLADPNSIVRQQMQTFITENAAYISENPDYEIVYGKDSNGKDLKIKVSALIGQEYGESAANGGAIVSGAVMKNNTIEVTDVGGSKVTYKLEFDNTGKPTKYVNTTDPNKSFAIEEFFDKVLSKAKSADAKTSVTRSSKKGKDATTAIPLSDEYVRKSTIMRETGNKNGGK